MIKFQKPLLSFLLVLLATEFPEALIGLKSKALAASCFPLNVVDGRGSVVEKNVSPPSTGITKDNWNTDFAVSGKTKYQDYIVDITPVKSGNYDVELYLKYSDNTTDNFYKKSNISLVAGKPLEVSATPRQGQMPYQVNVRVGGLEAIDKPYTVSVRGCR